MSGSGNALESDRGGLTNGFMLRVVALLIVVAVVVAAAAATVRVAKGAATATATVLAGEVESASTRR